MSPRPGPGRKAEHALWHALRSLPDDTFVYHGLHDLEAKRAKEGEAHTKADAAVAAARQVLVDATTKWDSAYGVFAKTGEKYALTPADAHAIGAVARGRTLNALALPLGVALEYDAKKDLLRVHVHRAPGMRFARVQLSPDPITAGSWTDLPGSGATHVVPSPAKGTTWARAASVTARASSDFTTPVGSTRGPRRLRARDDLLLDEHDRALPKSEHDPRSCRCARSRRGERLRAG